MSNDFKKFATRHLGMNSMVLDDVISTQNQYLNPYILEERQLNVTQMDVFSRLMMDRIIFLGTQILTVLAVVYMPVWVFMTPCSSSAAMWLPSVQVWLPVWLPYYWWQEQRASVVH